jgi:hypothetical protein
MAGLAKTFVIIAIVVSISLGTIFIYESKVMNRGYFQEIVLAKDVEVHLEWTVITAPMQVEKDNQYLTLAVSAPLDVDGYTQALTLPDGTIIRPEVVLVTDEGKEVVLKYLSSRSKGSLRYANFGDPTQTPKGKHFSSVKIRSDPPIHVQQVLWSGYNSADQP